MRKQIRKIIYVIIFLILAGIAYIVFDDYSTKNINDSSITYLLNTRSKKVHSKDCGVGKRSKEKNKQLKTDSLTNIVEAGYTICGDCNAGIRKSFLANFMGSFDDKINVDYDDIVLPTKEEYLQAVEEVGEWYVNHIPTYCKKLQEEEIKDYTGDDKKFFKAMTNNGFQIYDTNKIIDEEFIKEINGDFKLERGDIICREGHIHIYIGIEGTDNFGWGKVNRFYPANYKFSIEENSREYRIKMDKGNVEEYYTRVYRYKGGANE